MLLGHPKDKINFPRSNTLNHRKCINFDFINTAIQNLEKY
jgi:hypothetical protein